MKTSRFLKPEEMIINLARSAKYHVDVFNKHTVLVSCFDYRLANEINEIVQKYPGLRFVPGEEGMFKVTSKTWPATAAALRLTPTLTTKIESNLQNGFQLV